MIASKETNSVYFSELLSSDKRFAKSCNELTDLFEKHLIMYDFFKVTKDIWCRDYMPIQTGKGKFVQFRYEPSYLKDELESQSEPKEVCKSNNIHPVFSKINFDCGNVVNWSDRAIISDRVFEESTYYPSKKELRKHNINTKNIIISFENGKTKYGSL